MPIVTRSTKSHHNLSVGDRVEVKSLDEGFQGSWHVGKIIERRKGWWVVEYVHLLNDEETANLVEHVQVSSRVDRFGNCCSRLRPCPPFGEIEREKFCYGLCVDAYYNDAWWEGVIFDLNDGSESRKVFFPDIGDEMEMEIKDLRMTHDWDQLTDHWKPRGKWLFLEVIEEHQGYNFFPSSIKQMWYDLREGLDETADWACPNIKSLWKNLVDDIIGSHRSLTLDAFLSAYEFSKDALEDHKHSSVHSKTCVSSEGIDPQNEKAENNASALDPSNGSSPSCSGSKKPDKKCLLNKRFVVDSGSIDADPGSIDAYLLAERPGVEMTNNVRKYLYHIGWESLPKKYGRKVQIHYKSPDGGIFVNLRMVCERLKESAQIEKPSSVHSKAVASSEDIDPQNDDLVRGNEDCEPMIDEKAENNASAPDLSNGPNIRLDKKRTRKKKFVADSGLIDAYLLTNRPEAEMTNKVRKYLCHLGWELCTKQLPGRARTQYKSPDGKNFINLREVCESLKPIAHDSYPNAEDDAHKRISSSSRDVDSLNVKPTCYPESLWEYLEVMKNGGHKVTSQTRELGGKIKGYLTAMGWELYHVKKANGTVELRYKSPYTSRVYKTLLRVCQAIGKGLESNTMGHSGCEPLLSNADAQYERNGVIDRLKNGLSKCSSRKSKSRKLDGGHGGTWVNRSRKTVRQGCSSSFSLVPRTVLSWMIDNNVISSRKKVYYRDRKDLPSTGEGRITRMGIKCICCCKVFSLSSFAAHVGSDSCQPEANLFLEDERSLFDCQMEIICMNSWLMCEEPLKVESVCRNQNESWSDDICSICHYGGDLILCDLCPSAFHKGCLHLPDIPDGHWSCPSCCCGICGGSQFDVNSEQFTDTSALCCEQCERQYHAHCIRNREMVNLDARPTDKWFCCKTCEKIHWGLQQLVGKPILIGHNNLTCTVLKPIHYNNSDDFDVVTMARTNSKLLAALGVMHECFESVKEPQTRRDIVEDVILCRRSKLKRLNFGGFFTALLERDDELISVALLRVYGDKVAEIPLISTRFKHRRLGMCRILMNEIEKNLINLGVEKLVLPAAAGILNTWTTAFGFSSLTQSERSELLCYTFLDFQDTVMCQKPLKRCPSPLSNLVTENLDAHFESHQNAEDGTVLLNSEGNSGVSEVFQEQAEGSDSVNQAAQVNDSGGKHRAAGEDRGLGTSAPPVTDQPINKEISSCCTTEISKKKRANTGSKNGDRHLLFHKKRKTRGPRSSSPPPS